MGRRGGSRGASSRPSAASRTAAPPRPSAARPAATPARTSAPHPPQARPQASPVPQQAPMAAPSAGGGFMSTVAGVAAGSVLGHGISNALFGGHGGASTESAAPPPAAAGPAPMDAPASAQYYNPCEIPQYNFNQCLMQSNNDISACQHLFDTVQMCLRNNGYQQPNLPPPPRGFA